MTISVQRRVLDHALQPLGGEHHLHAGRRRAQRELGPPSEEEHPLPVPLRAAKHLHRLGQRPRAFLTGRCQRLQVTGRGGHPRSASPASSVVCGRYGPGRSPQSLGVGNTLLGLKVVPGSNAQRTFAMVSRSASVNISAM